MNAYIYIIHNLHTYFIDFVIFAGYIFRSVSISERTALIQMTIIHIDAIKFMEPFIIQVYDCALVSFETEKRER